MELEWFPFLVGPEVGSPTEVLHQLRSRFLLTDYGYLLQNITKWWSSDQRDFCFRSRYFRLRPGGKPCTFRVNIRADSGPILPGLRAEGHTRGFGLGDHFRSGYFRLRGCKGAPDADTTVDLLVDATKKTGFSIWKVRILTVNIPNYTENGEITPNLIIDQSTLITAILPLKYHNFPTFLRENLNLHPTSRQESETELTFLQRFSRGVLHDYFYTLIQLKFANVYSLLAATARCVRANQTAAENSSRRPDFYEMYSR